LAFSLGVDVGGTFTDAVAVDEEAGKMKWSKVYSTPPTFVEGVIRSIKELDIPSEEIVRFSHGTTIAINSVVERKYGQITGLICTKGFRDSLSIRRAQRRDLYNPWWVKSRDLIRRKFRIGVTGRINYKGETFVPLDEDEVRDTVRFLKERGIISYAVSTLHSYKNPVHEQRIGEIIREEHPDAFISLSSIVCPIIREYERTNTTVINAILMPVVSTYIAKLESELKNLGITSPVLLLKSNGGAMSSETAKIKPVEILEGGHAAGCIAARYIGGLVGDKNLITYDGGGTTATQSVIEGSELVYETLFSLEYGVTTATPTIGIKSIGQGGGAIAWIDKGGVLNVGPHSAGAIPGPVCYGTGGTEPTITDALVILGILDPYQDWIRKTPWKREDTLKVVKEKIGDYYGWDVNESAAGILKVAAGNVSSVFHETVMAKGRDPRDFTLFAFGGSGPMLSPLIAREHEIRRIIVPFATGTTSALGCLMSDIIYDYQHSYLTLTEHINYKIAQDLYGAAEIISSEDLKRDRVSGKLKKEYAADFRYLGQHWEVTVPLESMATASDFTSKAVEDGMQVFHREHERLFGFQRPDEPVELVTLRLRVTVPTPTRALEKLERDADSSKAKIGSREIIFDIEAGPQKSNVYDYIRLKAGVTINGPAVIHKHDGTVPLYPDCACTVDDYGNLLIALGKR